MMLPKSCCRCLDFFRRHLVLLCFGLSIVTGVGVWYRAYVVPAELQRDIRNLGGKAVGPLDWVRLRGDAASNQELVERLVSAGRPSNLEIRNGLSNGVLEAISRMRWLRSTTISVDFEPSRDAFDQMRKCASLERIELELLNLRKEHLTSIADCPKLELLILRDLSIHDRIEDALSRSESLKELIVYGVDLSREESKAFVVPTNLDTLVLRDTGLSKSFVDGIRHQHPSVEVVFIE